MPNSVLARQRLAVQGLVPQGQRLPAGVAVRWSTPAQVAAAFGCSQGQDLPGVISSLALRCGATAEHVRAAFDAGEIVRGYPMRGTLFVCAADDLAWITEICAGSSRTYDAKSLAERGLERATVRALAQEVGERVASGAPGVSREEFAGMLTARGIEPGGGNLYRVIASSMVWGDLRWGPMISDAAAQLLTPAPESPGLALERVFNGDRVAATAELASRYFASRGPASVEDFAWWSKLPMKLIRPALEQLHGVAELPQPGAADSAAQQVFVPENYEDLIAATPISAGSVHLLTGFDEFILGYRDRLFAMDEATHAQLVPGNNGMFKKSVVVGGRVRGFWSRTGSGARKKTEITEVNPTPQAASKRIERAAAAFPHLG